MNKRMTYGQIFEEGWKDCPMDKRNDILWNCTCYPAGTAEDIIKMLKNIRESSNNDVEKAMKISGEEFMSHQ